MDKSRPLPTAEGEAAGVYFYALGITEGVFGDDAITEHADGTYTLAVHSADGTVNCTLTNFLPVRHIAPAQFETYGLPESLSHQVQNPAGEPFSKVLFKPATPLKTTCSELSG